MSKTTTIQRIPSIRESYESQADFEHRRHRAIQDIAGAQPGDNSPVYLYDSRAVATGWSPRLGAFRERLMSVDELAGQQTRDPRTGRERISSRPLNAGELRREWEAHLAVERGRAEVSAQAVRDDRAAIAAALAALQEQGINPDLSSARVDTFGGLTTVRRRVRFSCGNEVDVEAGGAATVRRAVELAVEPAELAARRAAATAAQRQYETGGRTDADKAAMAAAQRAYDVARKAN